MAKNPQQPLKNNLPNKFPLNRLKLSERPYILFDKFEEVCEEI